METAQLTKRIRGIYSTYSCPRHARTEVLATCNGILTGDFGNVSSGDCDVWPDWVKAAWKPYLELAKKSNDHNGYIIPSPWPDRVSDIVLDFEWWHKASSTSITLDLGKLQDWWAWRPNTIIVYIANDRPCVVGRVSKHKDRVKDWGPHVYKFDNFDYEKGCPK